MQMNRSNFYKKHQNITGSIEPRHILNHGLLKISAYWPYKI